MNITNPSAIHACTSCQFCAAVCPKTAINIKLDEDGFYRPLVDNARCIDCGLCVDVCYKFDGNLKMSSPEDLQNEMLYAAWSRDDEVLKHTTSGGVGDLLARHLIACGYKVVGVVYNDMLARAEHQIADDVDKTSMFRGSKYIQSYTFGAMNEVFKRCRKEKFAVFGTPCQIYALNKMAEKRKVRENFIFIDLYCHGCPSLYVWHKYRQQIIHESKVENLEQVDFRSKIKGWGRYVLASYERGILIFKSQPGRDGFYELFFSDLVLNEGCHDCKLRSTLEYTDIRLGDFWGRKFLNSHKGVSAVSVVTDKGRTVWNDILGELEFRNSSYDDFLPFQSWGVVYRPTQHIRQLLLESLRNPNTGINDAITIYHKNQSLKEKSIRHIKNILYYMPLSLTNLLKRLI